MQVFLGEVARGEKDLAVAAGRSLTVFFFLTTKVVIISCSQECSTVRPVYSGRFKESTVEDSTKLGVFFGMIQIACVNSLR